MELHPQMIKKGNTNEYVVLSFAEYQNLLNLVEDYEDLMDLRQAQAEAKGQKGVPLEQVMMEFNLK